MGASRIGTPGGNRTPIVSLEDSRPSIRRPGHEEIGEIMRYGVFFIKGEVTVTLTAPKNCVGVGGLEPKHCCLFYPRGVE
jgi:hypothetical protein